ncbi:hypothetical protein L798_03531 [Zootermopsis nevadensis]|uniref:Uncharacterized protein n=1 Tax=Zootermopsis nevadensis TaxID=136037 RepID=A0A067QIJ9_ZOONE|nr:hypothetical protein L798_03531 [Zootermopsis nevadensis]
MPAVKSKSKRKMPAKRKSTRKVKSCAVSKRKCRPSTPKKPKGQGAKNPKKMIPKAAKEAVEDGLKISAIDEKTSPVEKK